MAFKNEKLYIFEPDDRVTVIKSWPDLRIWKLDGPGHWRCSRDIPEWILLSILDKEFLRESLNRCARLRATCESGDTDKPMSLSTYAQWAESRALMRYSDSIPSEARQRSRIFASRRWQILAFQARVPGSEDLIYSNPALAWLLANAWIFRGVGESRYALRNARFWIRRTQVEILKWLGFNGSHMLVNVLRRVNLKAMEPVNMLYLRSASHRPDVMRALAQIETINLDVLRIATDPHLFCNVTLQLLREVSDKARDTNYAWPCLAYKLKDALSLAKMHDLHLPKKVCSLRQLNELEEFIHALPGLRTA